MDRIALALEVQQHQASSLHPSAIRDAVLSYLNTRALTVCNGPVEVQKGENAILDQHVALLSMSDVPEEHHGRRLLAFQVRQASCACQTAAVSLYTCQAMQMQSPCVTHPVW